VRKAKYENESTTAQRRSAGGKHNGRMQLLYHLKLNTHVTEPSPFLSIPFFD
jgi:hypothetical protein